MVGCIIEPAPNEEILLDGKWCKDQDICYRFEDGKAYSGDPVMYDVGYKYYTRNVVKGSYYSEGIIVSELFEKSFGDVYYNVKSDVLIMYLGGVLFKFDRVWQ